MLKVSSHQQIDNELLECMDRGLGFLDQSTKRSVYWHIENSFGVSREKIIERPADFAEAIRKMFGQGSFFLERKMSEEIRLKFNVTDSRMVMSFPELVREVKNEFGSG